jgi:hypothetical protein
VTYKHLKPFKEGVLCFVVARRYKGKGPYKLILHEARATDNSIFEFTYGADSHWATGLPKAKNCKIVPKTKG